MQAFDIKGTSNPVPTPSPSPAPSITESQGQTIGNPDPIGITIADKKTPILVFFGPPQCGKTMSLVRMARYLIAKGFTVTPNRNFRSANDERYQSLCDSFNDIILSDKAQDSTNLIDFLLVEVRYKGKSICQILEAPGEGYFDPDDPDRKPPFRKYVDAVIASSNRKLWIVMVEPNWMAEKMRVRYVERIKHLRMKTKSSDDFLFLYNKIDDTQLQLSDNEVNVDQAIKDVKNLYPGIFEPFRETRPILSLFGGYNCGFAPFTTGTYYKHDGGVVYQESSDTYPANLWRIIRKKL